MYSLPKWRVGRPRRGARAAARHLPVGCRLHRWQPRGGQGGQGERRPAGALLRRHGPPRSIASEEASSTRAQYLERRASPVPSTVSRAVFLKVVARSLQILAPRSKHPCHAGGAPKARLGAGLPSGCPRSGAWSEPAPRNAPLDCLAAHWKRRSPRPRPALQSRCLSQCAQ